MAKFLARIELRDGAAADYDALHSAMGQRGFVREIVSGSNRHYELPDAMYSYVGNDTLDDARALAEAAAQEVGKQFRLLIVEYTRASWRLKELSA